MSTAAQRFRKKPVVIEAMQYDGSVPSAHAIVDWVWKIAGTSAAGFGPRGLWLTTLETDNDGIFVVSKKDFVICGVKKEFYACKPDIFEATYEPAE